MLFEKQPALLVTDCQSLHDAISRGRSRLFSSTDKRLAVDLAIVKSRATAGEADNSWINARCQVADCLYQACTEKFEEELQQGCNDAGNTTGRERRRRFRQEPSELRQQFVRSAEHGRFVPLCHVLSASFTSVLLTSP